MSERERPNYAERVEALRSGKRRHKAAPGECAYCDREREQGNTFHPSHEASPHCRSGRHNHCSCDTCF